MRRANIALVAAGALLIGGGSMAFAQAGAGGAAGASGSAGAAGAGASTSGSATTGLTPPLAAGAGSVGAGVDPGAVAPGTNPSLVNPAPGATPNSTLTPSTGYNATPSKTKKKTGHMGTGAATNPPSTLTPTPGAPTATLPPVNPAAPGAATSPPQS